MRRILVLSAALAVAACGGGSDSVDAGSSNSAWSGTWTGTLIDQGPCSDGEFLDAGASGLLILGSETNSQLTWQAACGASVIADVNSAGTVATLRPFACSAPAGDGGALETDSVTAGTLTLNGTSMAVDWSEHISLSGNVSGTCDTRLSGILTRH